MITSYCLGHKIVYLDQWRYLDTKERIKLRPCIRCGKTPKSLNSPDPCLGYIKGVKSACCGHGVEKGYIIRKSSYICMSAHIDRFP